jgi:hypothetical protein
MKSWRYTHNSYSIDGLPGLQLGVSDVEGELTSSPSSVARAGKGIIMSGIDRERRWIHGTWTHFIVGLLSGVSLGVVGMSVFAVLGGLVRLNVFRY